MNCVRTILFAMYRRSMYGCTEAMHARTHTLTHARTYTRAHTRTETYTYTHTHTHTYTCPTQRRSVFQLHKNHSLLSQKSDNKRQGALPANFPDRNPISLPVFAKIKITANKKSCLKYFRTTVRVREGWNSKKALAARGTEPFLLSPQWNY